MSVKRRKQMLVEERWKVEGGRWGWNPGGGAEEDGRRRGGR